MSPKANDAEIKRLIQLLSSSHDKDTRRQAAESLGQIGAGNPEAIKALVQLLGSRQNEDTRRQAAESLGKIDPGNPEAIKALVQLLGSRQNEDTRRQAAESLGKIDPGNPEAIKALVQLLGSSQNEYIRRQAAESLGQIDPGNPEAIKALIQLLGSSQNEYIRRQAAESLGQIDPGNPEAIKALIQLLGSSQDNYTRWQAAESLGQIGAGNPEAIKALIQLLGSSQDNFTRRLAAENLGKIDPGNPEAIKALVQLLGSSQNDDTRMQAAWSLGQIGAGNPKAIKALVQILGSSQNEETLRQAAKSLGKIGAGNPEAIKALIQLLGSSQNNDTRRQATESLEKISAGNPEAIKALVQILGSSHSYPVRRQIAESLQKVAIGDLEAIEKLRILRHTTKSEHIRHLAKEILNTIDSINKQTQGEDEDLLLFLQATRVKETVDKYFSVNNHQKTKFCYQRIIACLDKLQAGRDILTRRSLMNSYLEIYKKIVAFTINTRDLQTALLYVEIFKNRYLVERISQQELPLPKTIAPSLIESINQAKYTERLKLQEYTNGIDRKFDEQQLEELDKNWLEAKQELEKLYTQVAITEPEFIAKTKIYPITYEEIQGLLPPDTAILEFFFTDKELVTMLILPGTTSPIITESLSLPLKQASLEKIAQALAAAVATQNKNSKENLENQIQEMPQIIDQISDILKSRNLLNNIPANIQHLIVIPHHYLHLFPIHSLWLNDYQRLIDRFSVSYFPNLRVWKICQHRQRSQTTLIAIENPTEDKDLIFVKAEVASISQRQKFTQQQILTGKHASKTQILNLGASNHCFHFSGHAEYNFENPLYSYLMLSENTSDNLTLNSILTDLQMPHADLVTLSACCTGLVDAFQPTEEYLGLTTGFLLAGAKAVIGSQWKVNSIATAFLFDEFYRQLETINHKSIALKNAQNWLRCCTAEELRERAKTWNLSKLEPKEKFRLDRALKRLHNIPFENPYYWAAFILTGC
jgi:HEAT repeat protein/CHAT domain-containing protein